MRRCEQSARCTENSKVLFISIEYCELTLEESIASGAIDVRQLIPKKCKLYLSVVVVWSCISRGQSWRNRAIHSFSELNILPNAHSILNLVFIKIIIGASRRVVFNLLIVLIPQTTTPPVDTADKLEPFLNRRDNDNSVLAIAEKVDTRAEYTNLRAPIRNRSPWHIGMRSSGTLEFLISFSRAEVRSSKEYRPWAHIWWRCKNVLLTQTT